MRKACCLWVLLLAGANLRPQYVYTINADCVKITNASGTYKVRVIR